MFGNVANLQLCSLLVKSHCGFSILQFSPPSSISTNLLPPLLSGFLIRLDSRKRCAARASLGELQQGKEKPGGSPMKKPVQVALQVSSVSDDC